MVRLAWPARGPGAGEGSGRARSLSENDRARGFRSRTRAPAAAASSAGPCAVAGADSLSLGGFRRPARHGPSRAEHGDADGDWRSIGSASQRRTDLSSMRSVRRTRVEMCSRKLRSVSGSVFTDRELASFNYIFIDIYITSLPTKREMHLLLFVCCCSGQVCGSARSCSISMGGLCKVRLASNILLRTCQKVLRITETLTLH